MGLFDNFPYTNFHELNLDWIVKTIREYVEKVEDLSGEFSDLQENFDGLKQYVMSYFADLNVRQEVEAVLDQWLEDGTIDQIMSGPFVRYDQFYKQDFDGNLVLRHRTPAEDNGVSRSLQNGAVYSPNGDYRKTNTANRIYCYLITSDETKCQLHTFDMNNHLLNVLDVPNMQHGGPFAFKNGKGYSMNYGGLLTIYDLTNPSAPVIEDQRALTLDSSYIIGATESGFIGIKQDTTNHVLSVYEINDNFTIETYLYDIEGGLTGLFQDATVDVANNRLYWLSYEPNVIHIHNLATGEQLSQMTVPDVIGYVTTGEAEWIDVKNNNMYLSGFQGVGTPIDHKLDIKVWHATPQSMGDNSRKIAVNLAGYREISVRYQTADGLNGNVVSLNGSVVFKYIEDAQMASKAMNKGARININEDYPESWQMHVDAEYVFFNQSKTAPFVINANVVAEVRNVYGFLNTPNTYDGIPCWIQARSNSRVTFNNLNELTSDDDTMLLYAAHSDVTFLSAVDYLHHIAIRNGSIKSTAGIGEHFHAAGAMIDVPFIDASKYNTQFLSASCNIRCRVQNGTSARPTLTEIAAGNLRAPAQFTFQPRSMSSMGYRPLEPLYAYKGTDGSTTLTMGYYDDGSNSYKTYTVAVHRETVTPLYSALSGTYYRYWFSDISITNNPLGVALLNM